MNIESKMLEISALITEQKYSEAEKIVNRLLKKQGKDASVLGVAALLAQRENDLFKARGLMKKAVAIEPVNHALRHGYAEILLQQGQFEEALHQVNKAIELNVDNATYIGSKAECLFKLEAYEEAKQCFRQASYLQPQNDWFLNGLAVCLQKLDDLDLGLVEINKAIELNATNANSFNTRGAIYRELGFESKAMKDFERALELCPTAPGFYSNVALSLMHLNHYAAAIKHLRMALHLDSNNAVAAWNLSYCLLGLGFLKEGWVAYQFRKPREYLVDRVLTKWNHESLRANQLIVRPEQGIGDQIRLVSCLNDLTKNVDKYLVQCEPRLMPLFKRSFPDGIEWYPGSVSSNNLIAGQEQLQFETFMGDLPERYRNSLADFPEDEGYLVADQLRVAYWKKYLEQLPGKVKVGICWRSGVLTGHRKSQFPDIEQWEPILRVPDVTFINLFYDPCEEELTRIQDKLGIQIHTPEGIDLKQDLDDLAALLTAMDLTISVASSVLDLSGALMGTCTWDLTFRDKDDSHWLYCGEKYNPWCPSMKPIFAKGFDSCLKLAGDELSEILTMEDPAKELKRTGPIAYAYYVKQLPVKEAC